MGTLFVVATPLGNLGDISARALETLKTVNLVLCEDTRVTKKLLMRYEVTTPVATYHQHSKPEQMERIFENLAQGKNLALVSDAGTPGICDPGNELIEFILSKDSTISIIPIPGPSAVSAISSIAGIAMDKFLFLGYPPHKNKRKKFFQEVVASLHPVILYESPYRIVRTLKEMEALNSSLYIVMGRELTKKFESVYRGKIKEVLEALQKGVMKGEFVLVVYSNE